MKKKGKNHLKENITIVNYGGHKFHQIPIKDGSRKNVPQSDLYWYGLHIKKDGTHGHIEMYEPGGKHADYSEKIQVATDCIYWTELDAGEEWELKWPETAVTCVCTVWCNFHYLDIDIEEKKNIRVLTPSLPVERMLVTFLDKRGIPIKKKK